MTDILQLDDGASERYADVLVEVAADLAALDFAAAERHLYDIAGEVWVGNLKRLSQAGVPVMERGTRGLADRVRAAVFTRDGFRCTYCGGRTIPRCVLVAISDVFPDAIPYNRRYKAGTIHPAYWAVAPEADHLRAFSSGGSNEPENLTTLHAMCNTRKSDSLAEGLPVAGEIAPVDGWDGLIGRYRDVVRAGDLRGKRHTSVGYHANWFRHFGV